ncbi:MAG: FxsA family protein [Pseudomonadota bacterium]|nr:FxsA family protein [Pseudomonadota bacterium]
MLHRILALALFLPIIEIFVFIFASNFLSFSVIIIIILVSGIIGFYSLSLAKFKALAAIELVLNPDLDGQNQMLRSLMYFISGVLLLIPGLFSDLIGLILMFYATITKKSDSYKVEQKKADGTTIEGEYKNEG